MGQFLDFPSVKFKKSEKKRISPSFFFGQRVSFGYHEHTKNHFPKFGGENGKEKSKEEGNKEESH